MRGGRGQESQVVWQIHWQQVSSVWGFREHCNASSNASPTQQHKTGGYQEGRKLQKMPVSFSFTLRIQRFCFFFTMSQINILLGHVGRIIQEPSWKYPDVFLL